MWYDNLKVGDQVFVDYDTYYVNISLEKIDKITPKFIFIKGDRFSKETLKSKRSKIIEATPESIEEYKQKNLIEDKAYRFDRMDLSLEQKAACYDFLKGLKEKTL